MDFFIQQFQNLIHFAWLPVLIWTLFAGGITLLLKAANRIHPQYHYHIRLALIMGLPLGLMSAWLADKAAAYFTEPAALTIISMISPIEVGIGPNNSETYSSTEILFLVCGMLLVAGLLWYSGSRFIQWARLQSLRRSLNLSPIYDHPQLSSDNKRLAKETGKPILIGISGQDYIPVTFGVMQPVILIPESLTDTPHKMNLAIRHELTHIQQHDFGTHLFVTVIQSVFWFHPLVHLLANQIVEYREMRCDSLIIADSSVSRKEYASLLFELLPMPNLNQKVSVNMAQKSSNLKERIDRITRQSGNQVYPYRSSLTVLATLLVALTIGMACTDMQTQAVFDNEELDLMTDVDKTGERGYHQILIFMGEEGQSERHEDAMAKLSNLRPEYIESINVLKGETATEKYGDRAKHGVLEIRTKQDPESYNTALKALGMEPEMPPTPPRPGSGASDEGDYFVVVEEMPELIGGLSSIQTNIQYPEMARRAGIEGRVFVQFIVSENGDVEDARVIRGIGGGADEEALRAVSQAKFKPGVQRGQPVRVQYSLPVVFRLGNSAEQNVESNQPQMSRKSMTSNISFDNNIIRGTVTNGETGEPLSGTNVVIEGTNIGTVTNSNGEFTLNYQESDSARLIISYVGFVTQSVNLMQTRPDN
ncbi:TonB family protein [Rhodohalobacter sp. 8-1]|uniref:TonB family protein n=1 Tax=Rhodohalobacter sp. 8-1 TaxID=3131972 RepID=UPI0030EB1323